MSQQLNHQHNVFKQFRVLMGLEEDKKIDTVILIDGKQEEAEAEWKGLTQTMKKMIYSKLDEMTATNQRKMKK